MSIIHDAALTGSIAATELVEHLICENEVKLCQEEMYAVIRAAIETALILLADEQKRPHAN